MGRELRLLLVGLALVSEALAAAPAGRYTLAADTVKDEKTGLTWQRAVPATQRYKWAAASAYCQGLSLPGYTAGWRLPTRKELESLVDHSVSDPGPTIDPTAFPNSPPWAYWTSTVYTIPDGGTLYAGNLWAVYFRDGGSNHHDPNSSFWVRCVR